MRGLRDYCRLRLILWTRGVPLFFFFSLIYVGFGFFCFGRWFIHCHVQPYSLTFRNRKSCTLKSVNKSRSRFKRRRESVALFSTQNCIVGKTFPRLKNSLFSLADAPRCSIWGSVLNQTISGKVLFFIYLCSQQDTLFRPARCREMTTAEFYFCVW